MTTSHSNCNYCGNKNEFVKYTMSNNVIVIREQCFLCGCLHTLNFKRSLFDLDKLKFADLELRENYKNKRILQSDFKRTSERYYQDVYLKSDEWKNKRIVILEIYNYKCVCCLNDANDIHHINYDTVMKEDFNSLISVCRSCHQKIHFNGDVYFQNLKANFNVLKYCHSCKKYHNDLNSFCNNCKIKSYGS